MVVVAVSFLSYIKSTSSLVYVPLATPCHNMLQVPNSLEKLQSRVCTKWAKVCPAKPVPASYTRKDEFFMNMDEDSWKMRNMEKTMSKLTKKHK